MSDREDKILEAAMDVIISRCSDIKNSLAAFIFKLENEPNEPVNWPTMLDNYVLISSQISNLMKVLRSDKTPPLRNRIFLPLLLNPERDEELVKLTENRVPTFNHEMVPNYLRTKPEPEIEEKERQLYQNKSATLMNSSADQLTKQITALNKIVSNMVEAVKNVREDWDTTESTLKASQPVTSSHQDTHSIIAAINSGKGLRPGTDLQQKPGNQLDQLIRPLIVFCLCLKVRLCNCRSSHRNRNRHRTKRPPSRRTSSRTFRTVASTIVNSISFQPILCTIECSQRELSHAFAMHLDF